MLWGLLILPGCLQRVSWEIQPAPVVPLPSLTLAVIAEERGCKDMADAMVEALSARPGVSVSPSGAVELRVSDCTAGVQQRRESTYRGVDSASGGLPTAPPQETVRLFGVASARVQVRSPQAEPLLLTPEVSREVEVVTVSEAPLPMGVQGRLEDGLTREVGLYVADALAPLPETLRRTLYPDPEPGTARQLHNLAVEAEQGGDLEEALRLARAAYAADPSRQSLQYLGELEAHAARVGYARELPKGEERR